MLACLRYGAADGEGEIQKALAKRRKLCYNSPIKFRLELKGCVTLLADRLGNQRKAVKEPRVVVVP